MGKLTAAFRTFFCEEGDMHSPLCGSSDLREKGRLTSGKRQKVKIDFFHVAVRHEIEDVTFSSQHFLGHEVL